MGMDPRPGSFNPEEVERKFQQLCRVGSHPLVTILSGGQSQDGWQVVWCPVCGSVAVDGTVDANVSAGKIMGMRRPLKLNGMG